MRPRVVALGVLFRGDSILVEEQSGKHSRGTGFYYRPVGGTVEFGEKSVDTVIREFREEIGVEIQVSSHIACIENIFRIDGQIGHEIVQVYGVELLNAALYSHECFQVVEGDKVTVARWILISEFTAGNCVLYPDGLTERLAEVAALPCFSPLG